MPAQTATGTVAIQVEDFNDHCPILTTDLQTICIPLDSVTVTAKDEDSFPNGPPFHFNVIPEGTNGKWQAEHLNGEEKTTKAFMFAKDDSLRIRLLQKLSVKIYFEEVFLFGV